jgi:hypothetical protein
MMSTELAVAKNEAVNTDLDAFLGDFVRGGDFYPRLKFFNASATQVKRKKFPENHYGLIKSKEECVDLGETFAAVPLSYRVTALDFTEPGKCKRYHDLRSEEFIRVKKEAETKRPQDQQNPYLCGMEFLFWLPEYGYATLLCSNHSLKMCAGKLTGLCKAKRGVTFSHKLVDGKFVYEAPEVMAYIGAIEVPEEAWVKASAFARVTGSFQEEEDTTYTGEAAPAVAEEGRVR